MRVGSSQLREKALVALEDAVQECRYRRPRRSFALRFALAYLWAVHGGDRRFYDEYWRRLGLPHSPWSFGAANAALGDLYRALGLERDREAAMAMWTLHHEAQLKNEE